MSSTFDNLLSPVSQDAPCGDEHIYSRQLREVFSELRKPEQPDGEDDTSYRRAADWTSVVELAESALSEQTKDIRIVCHLIEAWTKIRGFAGLRDGLELLTTFVTTCWDRCNPAIEDGDLEVRVAPLENMLDDVDRGSCFPMTIRQIPLLGQDSNACDFLAYEELRQSKEDEAAEQLERIINTTDPDVFAALVQTVDKTLEQLAALKDALVEKLGDQAPGLTFLRDAIVDCQRVLKVNRSQVQPSETETEPVADDGIASETSESIDDTSGANSVGLDETAPARGGGGLSSREAAYRQLAEVAEYLKQIEPHSPIPYLLGRAVELGKLPFPQLVKQLVREEGMLDELRREFGITEMMEDTT